MESLKFHPEDASDMGRIDDSCSTTAPLSKNTEELKEEEPLPDLEETELKKYASVATINSN